MLLDLLKQLLPGSRAQSPPPSQAKIPEPSTLEHFMWLILPHDAPLDLHLHALFDGLRIGERDFNGLMQQALGETSSTVPGIKVIRRHAAPGISCATSRARRIPGAWAERGVYSGASATRPEALAPVRARCTRPH